MSIIDGLKQVAQTLREADKIPEYNAILDAQERMMKLLSENQGLKDQNKNLGLLLRKKEKVEYKNGAVWEKLGDGSYKGPCCPARCWEADHRTIPLTAVHMGDIKWHCPCCSGKFDRNIPEKHPNDPKSVKPQAVIET